MCTQEIRLSPPEASLCTGQRPRESGLPRWASKGGKHVEECEVLGLGVGRERSME